MLLGRCDPDAISGESIDPSLDRGGIPPGRYRPNAIRDGPVKLSLTIGRQPLSLVPVTLGVRRSRRTAGRLVRAVGPSDFDGDPRIVSA
jgi:hypothetical protein